MNISFIVAIAILAVMALIGYYRGLIRVAFSLAAMLLTVVLVAFFTPSMTNFLKNHTGVYDTLTTKCTQAVQKVTQKDAAEHIAAEDGAEELSGIHLPAVWISQITEKTGDAMGQALEESGAYQAVGSYLADWILRGISFFAAYLLVTIVLRLVVGILDIISKLPILKGINRTLGGVAGLVQGLLIVWMLLFIAALACTTKAGQAVLAEVESSKFLSFLYQNNILMLLLQNIFG